MPPATASNSSQRAFPVFPRVDRYFASPCAEDARRRITQCLVRGDGPALLLGAAGSGKSMLLEVISAELPNTLRVVRIGGGQLCTRRALLQSILHGLGEPFRDREEGELRLSLSETLNDATTSPDGVALLVDEAQSLPARLLEELRLLSNTALNGVPRLRVLLAGVKSLDETFTAPELSAFNQRIAARCYLEPLTREQTAQYVRAHIAAAGADPDELLSDDAYEAIQHASEGLPRLINQVCDRALVLAVERGREVVSGTAIQEAWSDLHQLSAPWQAPAGAAIAARSQQPDEGVLEFGVLDDELSDEAYLDDLEPTEIDEEAPAPQPTEQGVWNADEGLQGLTTKPQQANDPEEEETLDSDEPACIAYTFPTDPRTQPITTEDPEPIAPETEEQDEFLRANEPDPTDDEPEDRPLADNPFDEPFDEEEIVIDRFSDTALVHSGAEPEFGRMFGALSPAVEGLIEEVSQRIEGEQFGFAVIDQDEPSPTLVQSNSWVAAEGRQSQSDLLVEDDTNPTESALEPSVEEEAIAEPEDDVLVVEEDGPASAADSSAACRKDYAQLFANLRQG